MALIHSLSPSPACLPPPPLPPPCSCAQFIPVIFPPSVPFHWPDAPPLPGHTSFKLPLRCYLCPPSWSVSFSRVICSLSDLLWSYFSRVMFILIPIIVGTCPTLEVFSCLFDKDLCSLLRRCWKLTLFVHNFKSMSSLNAVYDEMVYFTQTLADQISLLLIHALPPVLVITF